MYTFDENIARLEEAKNDIKAAIEEKGVFVGNGLINTYANKIKMITGGDKPQSKTETIKTNNTTTTITPDEGFVLNKVTVKTQIPIQNEKTESITENGSYTIAADEEYEGVKQVKVDVDVKPNLIELNREYTTNNSEYTYEPTPDGGVDGFNPVKIKINIPIQSTKKETITESGTYTILPDEGYEAVETAEIAVNIPLETGLTKTYSTNGTYILTPTEGYKGIESANIVVDVQGEGKPQLPNGITFSGSTWETFDMGEYDWSNHYYFAYMFDNCSNLKRIENMPENLKPYGTTQYMFKNTKLKELPMIDLTNIGNTDFMFSSDINGWNDEDKPTVIPQYNMHNVMSAAYMFQNCNMIDTIPLLDFTNMRNCKGIFYTGYYGIKVTDNIGGFLNVRCNLELDEFRYITEQGILNVFNNLYDFTANCLTPDDTEGRIIMSNYAKDRLTDDLIAIATGKGWNVVLV